MYLPYGPVCPSVSYNFLKGGKLHFHGSIRALVKTLSTYHLTMPATYILDTLKVSLLLAKTFEFSSTVLSMIQEMK